MSDYPMLISNKLHSFRNFYLQTYGLIVNSAMIRGMFYLFSSHFFTFVVGFKSF